jgi:copper chaperone CopZ
MKTTTLDVGGMQSMLDYQAVERQLGKIPGVQRASASIASSGATVDYDEAISSVATLKDKILNDKINESGSTAWARSYPSMSANNTPDMLTSTACMLIMVRR